MDRNRLEIKLFGNVTIKLNNEDITGKLSGKSIAIICILMLKKNHRISRHELIEFLWPKSSDEAAKYNLRYNIWQLKKHLRVDEKTDDTGIDKDISGSSFLITTKDMCYINKDWEYYCDFTNISGADFRDNANISIEMLKDMCDSITGNLMENCYFEGCDSLDELILMNRYMIENYELKLLNMLISRMYEEKMYNECLTYLERCLKLDPYSSKNAKIKMEILIENNQMQEAKKFYNNYCKTLAFDLEIEPDIVALAEEIKAIQARSEVVEVVIDGESTIDFSVIKEIIDKLLDHEVLDITKYMEDQYVLGDLASISINLARRTNCIVNNSQPIRIVDSFKEFVEKMVKEKIVLSLIIEGKGDRISTETIEALAKEHKDSVRIKNYKG